VVIRRSIPRIGIEPMGRRPRMVEIRDTRGTMVLAQSSRTHDDEIGRFRTAATTDYVAGVANTNPQ